MKIENLKPSPNNREYFRRDRQRFIPKNAGCYILATLQDDILYVGLSKNLQRRFGEHLDDSGKTSKTQQGRASIFCWIGCDELHKVERTWLNSCEIEDGTLPILNELRSPVSV